MNYIVRDLNDPFAEGQQPDEMPPDHFNLERLFHMPSYGEDE